MLWGTLSVTITSLLIFVGYDICQQTIISSILPDENFH